MSEGENVDVSAVESVWQQVTHNKGEIDYAIFAYEKGSENKLRVHAQGKGGIAAAEENLRDGVVQFIVTKITLQMHGTPIQKTAFIFFADEGSLVPTRRAVVVRHQQQLADKIKAHVNINATQSSELTEESIVNRLRESSKKNSAAAEESKE